MSLEEAAASWEDLEEVATKVPSFLKGSGAPTEKAGGAGVGRDGRRPNRGRRNAGQGRGRAVDRRDR